MSESIEWDLDAYYDKDESDARRYQRFVRYANGLLFFIGAAEFPVLQDLVEDITGLYTELEQSVFVELVRDDDRFKLVGENPVIVSLPQVRDPQKLVEEFKNKGVDYAELL